MTVSMTTVDGGDNSVASRAPAMKKSDKALNQAARRVQERAEMKAYDGSAASRQHSLPRSVDTPSSVIDARTDSRVAKTENEPEHDKERSFDDFMGQSAPMGSVSNGHVSLKISRSEPNQTAQQLADDVTLAASSTNDLRSIASASGLDDGGWPRQAQYLTDLGGHGSNGINNDERHRHGGPDEPEANRQSNPYAEAAAENDKSRELQSPLATKISGATSATYFSPVRELTSLLSGSKAAEHPDLAMAQLKAADQPGKSSNSIAMSDIPAITGQIDRDQPRDTSRHGDNTKQHDRERPRGTADTARHENAKSPLLAAWNALTAAAETSNSSQGAGLLPPSQQLSRDILAALPSVAADERSPSHEIAPNVIGTGRMLRMLDITLEPANLGAVHVRLELRDGTLSLAVTADRAATALILDQEQDALCQRLAEAGYNDATISISDGQSDQQVTRDPIANQEDRQTGNQNFGSGFSSGSNQPNASSNSRSDVRLSSAGMDETLNQPADSTKRLSQSKTAELYI